MKKIVVFFLLIFLVSCAKNEPNKHDENKEALQAIRENRMDHMVEEANNNDETFFFESYELSVKLNERKEIFVIVKNYNSEGTNYKLTLEDCQLINSEECVVETGFFEDFYIATKEQTLFPIRFIGKNIGISELNFLVSSDLGNKIEKTIMVKVI